MKLFILILSLFSCSTIEIETREYKNTEFEHSTKEIEIFEDINQYRQSIGLNTLTLDNYLSNKCLEHNNTMISLGYLTHSGFEYRSSQIKSTFPTTKVGECLSHNYQNPLIGWLNSPPHKEIIETENYNYIGVSFKDNFCTIILIK